MGRIMGYYIAPSHHLHQAYSVTKRGAEKKAKEFLEDARIKSVTIIRADDYQLMFTYSKNEEGLVNVEKA